MVLYHPQHHSEISRRRFTFHVDSMFFVFHLQPDIFCQISIFQICQFTIQQIHLLRSIIFLRNHSVLVKHFIDQKQRQSWTLLNDALKCTVIRLVEPLLFCFFLLFLIRFIQVFLIHFGLCSFFHFHHTPLLFFFQHRSLIKRIRTQNPLQQPAENRALHILCGKVHFRTAIVTLMPLSVSSDTAAPSLYQSLHGQLIGHSRPSSHSPTFVGFSDKIIRRQPSCPAVRCKVNGAHTGFRFHSLSAAGRSESFPGEACCPDSCTENHEEDSSMPIPCDTDH